MTDERKSPGLWPPSQRKLIASLVLVFVAVMTVRYVLNPMLIADPPGSAPRDTELADRLDPNTADEASLAAIPTFGSKRAAEVVAYRRQYLRDGRGDVPFRRIEDLLKINGIGVATLQTIRPYLLLPEEGPTTRP